MAFSLGSLPWGDILKLGGSLLGADRSASGARDIARQATPTPYGVSGPGGTVGVDPRTQQINLQMADNPFARLFNALGASSFANAAVAPGSAMYGANPELISAYQGLFGQGLTDTIQGQLDLLRQAAAPEENRQRLGLDDQLFSRGMLGTTGGAERFRALTEAQGQADLNRQLAAVGLGQQEAQNRFQGALGTIGQGMNAQNQNFNIGMGSFGGMQGLFQNLLNQANIGVGASSGMAPGLAPWLHQQQQSPYTTGFNFLSNSGIFDWLNGRGGSGGVPMVSQPSLPPISVTPPSQFPMPSGNFGL